jgi:hypothetical protein
MLSLSMVILSAVLANEGTAPQERFALQWDAPACAPRPDPERLFAVGTRGAARVTVSPVQGGWQLCVSVSSPTVSERAISAATCEEAGSAAALLLRLAVEPPAIANDSTAQPVSTQVAFGLFVGGGFETSPAVTPLIGASGMLNIGSFTIGAHLRTTVPVTVGGGPNLAAGVEVHSALEGQLDACWLPRLGRLAVGPCASVAAAWWRVRGVNISEPNTTSVPFITAGPTLRAAVDLSRHLVLQASVMGGFSLTRPRVFFEGYGDVLATSWIAAAVEVGLGWRW